MNFGFQYASMTVQGFLHEKCIMHFAGTHFGCIVCLFLNTQCNLILFCSSAAVADEQKEEAVVPLMHADRIAKQQSLASEAVALKLDPPALLCVESFCFFYFKS